MMTNKKSPIIQDLSHITLTQPMGNLVKLNGNRDIILFPVTKNIFKNLEKFSKKPNRKTVRGNWTLALYIIP